MLRVIKRVAKDITDRHGASNVFTNIGDYQSNKHLHWHVVFGEAIR
jgi:histidine triad (HIT) family protein